jgi:MGT family glycosyltransferase
MARAWFYNIPYHGHVNPTLPLVRELVERGDEITYFAGPAFEERIRATGARYGSYRNQEIFQQSRNDNHMVLQGSLLAESTNALLAEVLEATGEARPDYILFDMSAPWGNIASRRYAIPAIVSFPHMPFYWRMVVDDPRIFRKAITGVRPGLGYWRALGRQTTKMVVDHKLRTPADVNVLSSSADLNIAFLTRYFQPYEERFDSSYVFVGPTIDTSRPEATIEISKRPDQQLVYIAVGTLYKANVEFFQACMTAFADPQYAVIMSIGKAVDPMDLGRIPANFTVSQYVPQLQILQQADLFITHGGMSSINEAVAFGVPMVVVPNTIEQSINAARLEELRCGLYLDLAQLTVETLQNAAMRVLQDPTLSSGLPDLLQSFEDAGGTQLAADTIDQFKQLHAI